MLNIDDHDEMSLPPLFEVGDKVRAAVDVRDDGTFPGSRRGELLIAAGDVGYVRDIGEFLQIHRIYAVDFYERARIVGMWAAELVPFQQAPERRETSQPTSPSGEAE